MAKSTTSLTAPSVGEGRIRRRMSENAELICWTNPFQTNSGMTTARRQR